MKFETKIEIILHITKVRYLTLGTFRFCFLRDRYYIACHVQAYSMWG